MLPHILKPPEEFQIMLDNRVYNLKDPLEFQEAFSITSLKLKSSIAERDSKSQDKNTQKRAQQEKLEIMQRKELNSAKKEFEYAFKDAALSLGALKGKINPKEYSREQEELNSYDDTYQKLINDRIIKFMNSFIYCLSLYVYHGSLCANKYL